VYNGYLLVRGIHLYTPRRVHPPATLGVPISSFDPHVSDQLYPGPFETDIFNITLFLCLTFAMACTGHHPRIAVIAIIPDAEGRIVAGQRLSPLGTNQWSFPGGHLDQNESFFGCAERETLEETGLRIRATKILAITNDVFEDAGKHYVSVFVRAERVDGEQEPVVSSFRV
jgi:ADP-ribose pyrophosphatase YjhB (NUDIX family)